MNTENIAVSLPIFLRGFTQFEISGTENRVEGTHYRYDHALQKAEWLDTPAGIFCTGGTSRESGYDTTNSGGNDDYKVTDHPFIDDPNMPPLPMGPN